jgi:hypothetical protein
VYWVLEVTGESRETRRQIPDLMMPTFCGVGRRGPVKKAYLSGAESTMEAV